MATVPGREGTAGPGPGESHGTCALCGRFRPFGMTQERLARERVLAATPAGARRAPSGEVPGA
jgi:hypothetical protein